MSGLVCFVCFSCCLVLFFFVCLFWVFFNWGGGLGGGGIFGASYFLFLVIKLNKLMSNVILILVEPQFWYDHGQESMQTILKAKQEGVAKNVIMFLGDGMGVSTATGGRIWAGQQLGMNGEEHELSWDKFPFTGLSKVIRVYTC